MSKHGTDVVTRRLAESKSAVLQEIREAAAKDPTLRVDRSAVGQGLDRTIDRFAQQPNYLSELDEIARSSAN